jgi:hypothetical protein
MVVPTAVACAAATSSQPSTHATQDAARKFLSQFAGTLPASAIHRVVMFPLLGQLQLGDHVATALLSVCFPSATATAFPLNNLFVQHGQVGFADHTKHS